MRVSRDDLQRFGRTVPPAPAPIEPRLAPADEARVIAKAEPGDTDAARRRHRVLVLLRRPAAPTGEDAELIALLALAKALPLERDDDRLRARQRLVEIGRAQEPPEHVRAVFARLALEPGDGEALATALLPVTQKTDPFSENRVGFGPV